MNNITWPEKSENDSKIGKIEGYNTRFGRSRNPKIGGHWMPHGFIKGQFKELPWFRINRHITPFTTILWNFDVSPKKDKWGYLDAFMCNAMSMNLPEIH